MLFAQTSYAMLHAFDAETGRLLWSAQLGERTGFARGVAANSFAVFVTNADTLFASTRKPGGRSGRYASGTIPDDRAGLRRRAGDGRARRPARSTRMTLKHRDEKGNATILTAPVEAWNWQAGGPMLTRPLPADKSWRSARPTARPTSSWPTSGPRSSGFRPADRSVRAWRDTAPALC